VSSTRYSHPLAEGEDPLPWLRAELPTWSHGPAQDGTWWAQSPTFAVDGLHITAPDPVELVERVRAFERLVALAAGRAGRLAVGRPFGGTKLEEPSPRAAVRSHVLTQLSDPTGLGPATGPSAIEEARAKGYSGNPCTTCGSLDTRYDGTCLVCDNCGTTSGCS
jgi:hypothetical protein